MLSLVLSRFDSGVVAIEHSIKAPQSRRAFKNVLDAVAVPLGGEGRASVHVVLSVHVAVTVQLDLMIA